MWFGPFSRPKSAVKVGPGSELPQSLGILRAGFWPGLTGHRSSNLLYLMYLIVLHLLDTKGLTQAGAFFFFNAQTQMEPKGPEAAVEACLVML